jgi:hypothetical protein
LTVPYDAISRATLGVDGSACDKDEGEENAEEIHCFFEFSGRFEEFI